MDRRIFCSTGSRCLRCSHPRGLLGRRRTWQSSNTQASTSSRPSTMVAVGDGATVPDLPGPTNVRVDGLSVSTPWMRCPRAATFDAALRRVSATTGEALDAKLPALADLHPRVTVVLFGIDDLNPDEHVTSEQFGANFASLLDALVASSVKMILVATIPDEATGADTLNPLIRQAVADRHLDAGRSDAAHARRRSAPGWPLHSRHRESSERSRPRSPRRIAVSTRDCATQTRYRRDTRTPIFLRFAK